MKKGQVNIDYKGRRIAFSNSEKLVGQAVRYTTIPYAAIIAYAAKAAGVPESSIALAMEALYDAMNYFVLNGHSVQIPHLGTFSICVSVKTSTSESEFTSNFAKNLRRVYIRFLPDPELKAMIASTAINTSVNMEGYNDNGVIAVRSASFAAGNTLVPMTEGRTYAIGTINRISLAGSRLSATYLGGTPVQIKFIDGAGEEHSVRVAGTIVSMSYSALSINLKNFLVAQPDAKFLKELTISDKDGNVILDKVFGDAVSTPYISGVNIADKPIAVGGTADYVPNQPVKVKVFGVNLAAADILKIGNTDVEADAGNTDYLLITFTPQATGNAPITVGITGGALCSYNLSFGEQGGVVITSVTAGGDALVNGGTTNITDGSNYQIAIAGTGLDNLTADNFVVPENSVLTITSKSDTLILATMSAAHAGDFKVVVEGAAIFAAALVVVTPAFDIDGYSETAEGNAVSFATALTVTTGEAKDVYIKGDDVDELTQADFVGNNVTVNSYTPATGLLNVTLTTSPGQVFIKQDGTTIATLTLQTMGSTGSDGLDKD